MTKSITSVGRIRFDDGTSSYWLGSRDSSGEIALTDREIRRLLARWLAAEPWSTQLRRFIAQEIRVEARTDDALIDRACAMMSARGLGLSHGECVIAQDPTSRFEATEMLAEPLQAAATEDETHWIHVIVMDQDDQPLAGVPYRIKLTDGRVREGRTTAEGGIFFDEIPAGQCSLSLLEHDEKLWDLAGGS